MTRPPAHALVLAIDQGTTGTTVLALDHEGTVRARGYAELPQHFPQPGWVEHDGGEIWRSVLDALAAARAEVPGAPIAAIGITNQRETALLWDRATGEPAARAIVWQDRRTADRCAALKRRGLEPEVRRRTGLWLTPDRGRVAAAEVAAVLARRLGWDEARRRVELQRYHDALADEERLLRRAWEEP